MTSKLRKLNTLFLLSRMKAPVANIIHYFTRKWGNIQKILTSSIEYELIDLNQFSRIIKILLTEYNTKYNIHAYDIIEEYYIGDLVRVFIARKDSELYYIVNEPSIDFDKASLIIATFLKYGDECTETDCLVDIIENHLPDKLDLFLENIGTILYYYRKLKSGFGALYPIIIDDQIEEASANQKEGFIYVIHRKYLWYGWIKTNIKMSPRGINYLALSLARKAGKHLSLSNPLTEGLTSEGVRIAVTYSNEVSRHGTSFVIRKKPGKPWTITRVINEEMISPILAAYLWLVLEMRGTILIVGGVSTGKTTLLQALLTLIPPSRRVITIEDTPEITYTTGLWDPLIVRYSYSSETSIDEYKLLKFALRRRADYIVVGEVRGKEARLLIQASRLGHSVITTFHADDAHSAIERLIAPPISIPRNLLSSIWVIVSMEPTGANSKRRVKEIHELSPDTKKLYMIGSYDQEKQAFTPDNVNEIVGKTVRLKHILDEDILLQELENKTIFLSKLVEKGIFDLNEISRNIQRYYSLEDEVLEKSREAI